MNIVVVGAGIGGLTFALSAHRLGMNIRVYESVAELRPLGVGLNLQPNAVRELTELGLGEMLASTAIPTAELA
ncbi:MAG TPA: NAD(P)-binding protein, partial [Mesorhizobium sp.]|nr:NAD(P)-binding protein [Mesorhizobium sp.]